jgi:hypothetical protein
MPDVADTALEALEGAERIHLAAAGPSDRDEKPAGRIDPIASPVGGDGNSRRLRKFDARPK